MGSFVDFARTYFQHPTMSQTRVLSAAVATAMALGLLPAAACAHDMSDKAAAKRGKEKCYGVAKAGENACANLSGTHDCAGEASTDRSPADFKLVPKGTCAQIGGLSAEAAKAALAKATGEGKQP